MKITKSQFVQLIKESYQKKMLSEAGNDQGEDLDLNQMSADVRAILNQVNTRVQGKAEWTEFAIICLEFLLEYKLEGATDTDLQDAAKQVGGSNGTRLYALLKIIAQEQTKKQKEDPTEQEQGQPERPANRSDLEEGKYDSLNKTQDSSRVDGIISRLEKMELDQEQKKALEALKKNRKLSAAKALYKNITGNDDLDDVDAWWND